jgi:hypothetical protein
VSSGAVQAELCRMAILVCVHYGRTALMLELPPCWRQKPRMTTCREGDVSGHWVTVFANTL